MRSTAPAVSPAHLGSVLGVEGGYGFAEEASCLTLLAPIIGTPTEILSTGKRNGDQLVTKPVPIWTSSCCEHSAFWHVKSSGGFQTFLFHFFEGVGILAYILRLKPKHRKCPCGCSLERRKHVYSPLIRPNLNSVML